MKYAFAHKYTRVNAYESIDGHPYFCFRCKEKFILRKGKVKAWHYVHHRGSLCIYRKSIPFSDIKIEDNEEKYKNNALMFR